MREYKHIPDSPIDTVMDDINPPFNPNEIDVQYGKHKQAVYICKGSITLMYITKPETQLVWQAFIKNAKELHGVDVDESFFTFQTTQHETKC
jgi:hypothetical protein